MNLKTLRVSRRLSQEQLADMSGLNVRTIQRIEKGCAVRAETIKCLASALDVDASVVEKAIRLNGVNDRIQKEKLEIYTLLIVGALFILFGMSAIVEHQENVIGAIFYFSSAFCFIVSAVKMRKNKIYC